MLNTLVTLITQGGLKGVNVTVRPYGDDKLFVMLSPELNSFNDEKAHVDTKSDSYYAIRSALSQAVQFVGTAEEVDSQLASFVAGAAQSYNKAVESMSAVAVAAKLDAASDTAKAAATTAEPKAEKKPAKGKDKGKQPEAKPEPKAAAKEPEKAPEQPATATEEPAAPASPKQDSFAAFDDIDSI